MSWGLDLRDSEVYVLLNGRRARDINTGEEFGAVEFLDHGRTADELWLRFHGTKTGRRLLRSRFRSCCEELQELDSVSSNAEFLNVLKNSTANIGPKRSPGPTAKKRKSQPQLPVPNNVPLPSETTLSPEQVIVADKKVGEFNVSLERLSMAPQEFRCRDVDTKWASEIKNSIRNAPGSIITTLPALLDPSVIADPSEFKAETVKDVNIKMFLLGGNHLTSACRQLLLEEPDNEIFSYYRHVNIELYVGLTPEEAKLVGNVHNRATSSKSILFQDLVRQARSIYIRDETGDKWKDTATVVLSHIQQKKCSKDSLWVVFSVAAYGTEAYTEAERIFNLWESVEVPQHLFKALMGMEEEVRCQYLRRVEVRPDLKKITNNLKTEKKRTILKEVFLEKTQCSTWEEAEETYEPYVHMVDDYLDFNINRRCVPTEFVKFCDAAKEHRAMESVDISVDINLTSRTHQDLINHNSIKSLVTSTKRKLEDRVRQILKKIKPDD
ncbi:uncharacterized protein LOC128162125 [Crassostrea angulata]|uniref:uncharacterized protein LOC128162125 n=1 Tax=Magallana angulata TaxID=2784310 RepID=UPI0022B0C6B3|nr:uncharacterized protein LOC128162125 [Crassostrea angulata]